MKTLETIEFDGVRELSDAELQNCTGGGFAYDVGFLFRELYVYASHGGGILGTQAIAIDLGVNYRPK